MKAFTRIFLLLIFISLAFQSCIYGYKDIYGNGELVRKEFPISDYNVIVLNLPADIIYHNDSISAPYFQIYTDSNILPHIRVMVKDNQLIISSEEGADLRATNFKIFTNSKTLEAVNVNGLGSIRLKSEVNAKAMKIDISGSGSVLAESLYCEQINLNISGSGKMNLKGVSNYTDLNISGSGKIEALEFSSLEANATISGSGYMILLVGRKLDATVFGSGIIKYKGNLDLEDKKVFGKKV
ncbi:MAG: DUF2807 domain-containing protein [Candidatus Azobacteroides sp.]|nr:DUF2807 domain-containing protein [Candidatus Azobacteroides sp.]